MAAACRPVYSQRIAYYDARTLAELYERTGKKIPPDDPAVQTILQGYFAPGADIAAAIGSNPFLSPYFRQGGEASLSAGDQGILNARGGIAATLGGLDVTTLANGVSQLMIDRAKQELTIAFFNRFRRFVAQYPEVQVLFPKTTDNLNNLLSYHYPEMLPALRAGFLEDLKKLPEHLDGILALERYQDALKNMPEIRIAIRSLRIVHQLESGSNPAELLNTFAGFPDWQGITTGYLANMKGGVQVAALFSQSLRNDKNISGDNVRTWITGKEAGLLMTDEVLFRLYIGLICQQASTTGIAFYINNHTVGFDELLKAKKDRLLLLQNQVAKFTELAVKADNIKTDLQDKKASHTALSNDDIYSYIGTSIDVIEYGFSLAKIFSKELEVTDYLKTARKCNDLYRYTYREEYPQALTAAVDILSELFTRINAGTGNADARKLSRVMDDIRKYGLFMANVAVAKTADDVEKALDAAILPVGSSSIKKNSAFNISIQSYLGAYARLSPAYKDQNNENLNIAWNDGFGVTAPIGVSFSWGLSAGKKRNAGSVTLFAALLDLGAIVDYRLKRDTVTSGTGQQTGVVEKEYKVRLGQLFSPGAYVVYGCPWNIPLSLGIGGQYGPGLSKIDNGAAVINNPYWRWNAFLAVDIPFFNLYTKRR